MNLALTLGCGLFLAICLIVFFVLAMRSPHGYQDENGYNDGEIR